MGRTLQAIVEAWYPALNRWIALCQWDFGKAYDLMLALERAAPYSRGCPQDASPEAQGEIAGEDWQVFEAGNPSLPSPDGFLAEYRSMLACLNPPGIVGIPRRVLFYRI